MVHKTIIETVTQGHQGRRPAQLQVIMDRFTWAAVDLKIKDMESCKSQTKYFEQKLASHAWTAAVARCHCGQVDDAPDAAGLVAVCV
ncbi:TPA: hypothetical protein N0F65_004185 [Lagenidium giganteum]|uniref:Uncharacterized protein n=1 Tax=Lagenidium giganteum TaxID=4803 RepID=A0AAV2YMM1_9STRA|nr:TPA: hypothetical protein N0F65_004185 [Lagenidium giganteum]